MSGDQYKEQFISEAKDHLNSINDHLLEFEKDPTNEDPIHGLFRSFHTLKGNASTMGFTRYSELAHHLEDLLDKIRNKQIEADSELLDVLFKGTDCLEEGLNLISKDQPEEINDSEVLEKIKEILSSKGVKKEEKSEKKLEIEFSESEKKKIKELKGENFVLKISLEFEDDSTLKLAKALLAIRSIEQACEVIKLFPPKEEIKSGNFGTEIFVVVASKKGIEELENLFKTITGIKSHNISNLQEQDDSGTSNVPKTPSKEPPKSPDKENVVDSKEEDKAKIAKQQQEAMSKQMQTVKIDIKSLDNLMDLVGELLISKVRLEQYAKNSTDKDFNSVVDNLTRMTIDIQDEVMKQRMIPIGNIFNRFPRMVRDLAKKENKQVNLVIEGQDIEFDRTVLDEIGDPLVHLLRNSVDHGIELPQERKDKGKSPEGTIYLTARKEKTNAIVEVSDDGAGIDGERVKKSAIKKGVITQEEADQLTDKELKRLIFRPGMSTNESVTEVSGRGVGMDVVETKIKNLGGNVKLDSELGKGTKIKLQLPLTLAIVNSLIVLIDDSKYALPLSTIERTVKIKKRDIKTIHGNPVFILMNEDVPLICLSELLHGKPRKDIDTYTVIVVDKEDSKIGLVVDNILTQQQVLIKGLDEMVKGIKGLGGATILGDGKVAMILDVATLFD